MDKLASIGVLDSGVGGLSVLQCLHQMLPHEDFIYVGDTARTPYGTRTEAEIRGFVGEIIDWLAAQGVKQVIIACNTLTMLGVDSLKGAHPFSVVGMSKGAQLLLSVSKKKKIGVMGTQFTVNSGLHKKAILEADSEAEVFPVACPDFVPIIEGGLFESPALTHAIEQYTAPLMASGVDAVILACTHYPFIKSQLAEAMGDEVKIVDPAAATSGDAILALKHDGLLRTEGKGTVKICCTADIDRVRKLAARMMPVENCTFELIDLHQK